MADTFVRWLALIDSCFGPGDYVSRRLYRLYLQETLDHTRRQKPEWIDHLVDPRERGGHMSEQRERPPLLGAEVRVRSALEGQSRDPVRWGARSIGAERIRREGVASRNESMGAWGTGRSLAERPRVYSGTERYSFQDLKTSLVVDVVAKRKSVDSRKRVCESVLHRMNLLSETIRQVRRTLAECGRAGLFSMAGGRFVRP